MNSKVFQIGIVCVFGWVMTYLAFNVFRGYGFGLFVWLPLLMGLMSTVLCSYNSIAGKKEIRQTAYLTLVIFCLGLFTFAWEGIICLAMALPIGFFFTWLGYKIGYAIMKHRSARHIPILIAFLLLSDPLLMAFENIVVDDEVRSVTTSIEINAPAQQVWRNVIEFPELKPPGEFIFKTGIAYPTSAHIIGSGKGAVRYCNFSTGAFVEPITIWQEPALLAFAVKEQPEPMRELSFYDIHPNHLHGYWVSQKGQFKLTQLSNGHTLVEGTTWYVNKIRPGIYWTLWSDYIVHKIHLRVLEYIKQLSEA